MLNLATNAFWSSIFVTTWLKSSLFFWFVVVVVVVVVVGSGNCFGRKTVRLIMCKTKKKVKEEKSAIRPVN